MQNSVVPWLNRFTTGRIPADAKGATMAELDEPADENQIENRSQNNIFCSRIINLSFNALAYNTREHFAHCYRHSQRRNQDVSEYSYQKIEANCKITSFFFGGIISLLFDGLA